MIADDFFEKPTRRKIQDLNIVPILDMLTVIIFFLLMSTSFMEYTKVTLPPSATAAVSTPNNIPPLAAKIMLVTDGDETSYRLTMIWGGEHPGEVTQSVGALDPEEARKMVAHESRKMAENFS